MAKKSEPLSLESLLEAQQRLLSASNLTEEQRKRAEDQIAKLEELRKATTETQDKQTEVVNQVKVMTRPKGDSKNVTLGDVRTELKEMRKDLKTFAGAEPNPSRKPLQRSRGQVVDADFKEVPGISKTRRNAERVERLSNIGATLGEKAELYQKGAGKEVTTAKNAETFQRFIAETKDREDLLKNASEEQIKLFERLEDTLLKLRDSDAKDSAELRKELAKIAGELETTDDTAAKKNIGGVLEQSRNRARVGGRGESGTLGDAWSALTGQQKVLKSGYEFDQRLPGGVRRTQGNEFGAAGRIPSAKKGEVFSMGRVAGAATIAGNFFRSKIEDYNAANASNVGSNFLDRTVGGNRLEEERARLGARAEALTRGRDGQDNTAPGAVPAGRGKATALPQASSKVNAMTVTAAVVNLRGPVKLPGSGPNWNAGNSAAGASRDWPPKVGAAPTTSISVVVNTKNEEQSSGIGLPDLNLMGRGKGMLGRAGSGIMSAGRGILSTGKNLLGKIPGGALKGGIAGVAGLGLSYGGDKLKEAGYEKTGAAADIAGQAATWGGTGAMLGSVIPGIGTAVGAGVGAVAGGAYGLYKNWGSLFGGKKSESGTATAMPASPMVTAPATAAAPMVMPAQSNAVGVQQSVVTAERETKQQYLQKVGSLSKDNVAAKETSNKPVIIQQPAANPAPAPAPAPQTFMPRGGVRSSESAMERYSNRNAHFY